MAHVDRRRFVARVLCPVCAIAAGVGQVSVAVECRECKGTGKCRDCGGLGTSQCNRCNGTGKKDDKVCPVCLGRKNLKCSKCEGAKQCFRCKGIGKD